MKRIIGLLIISIFLTGCGYSQPKPPDDLVENILELGKDEVDFKIVDYYEFPLNDADKSNEATEKWCIAFTESAIGPSKRYEPLGIAFLEVKINDKWELLDGIYFSPFEQYPAEKTSCEYFKSKYLQ